MMRGAPFRPALVAAVVLLGLAGTAAPSAAQAPDAATTTVQQKAGALAQANVGKGAGSCSVRNPAPNSLGGSAFRSSCHGAGGLPEYWCADFAAWVWANAGLYTAGITASAATFVTSGAGVVHVDPSYVPQVGDAIVFDFDGGHYADHVGLVAGVNPDGSVVTVNGDFGGRGSGATFARTSLVRSVTIRASSRAVGSTPGRIGMTITDYVSPRLVPPSVPASSLDADGHPNVFWRDASGALRHAWSSAGAWQPTGVLATGLLGDPATGPGLDVAWVAVGGVLERTTFSSGAWGAPEVLPTGGQRLDGRPALATDANGIENVFWRGPDRRLYHDYLVGGAWQGPEAIGSGLRSDPVAVAPSGAGEIDVLAQGPRHGLLLSRFSDGRWQGSTTLGIGSASVAGRPSAVVDPSGAIDVLWRQVDATLAVAGLADGIAGAPTTIGTGLGTTPAAAEGAGVVVAAFGALADGSIWASSTTGSGWTPPVAVVGGRQVPGEPTVLVGPEGPEVLWISTSGSLQSSTLVAGAFDAPRTVWRP